MHFVKQLFVYEEVVYIWQFLYLILFLYFICH